MPAIKSHTTATVDTAWDGPLQKKNCKMNMDEAYYGKVFAWRDPDSDPALKGSYKFVHHEVSADGTPGAANINGCSAGIAVLNGGRGGTTIPDADRQGVYDHLDKHIKDAGKEASPLQNSVRGYSVKAQNQEAEIWIYEEIGDFWDGGISAKGFAEDLKGMAGVKNIALHLNSPGGVVWDGLAIYNLLKKHPAKVTVNIDGLAASIASVIAMAGDEINMAENAMLMIHEPWSVTIGNAADMRLAADKLDKIRDSILLAYLNQKKKMMPGEEMEPMRQVLSDMMAAETWMSAQEARDCGLITQVTSSLDMAAHFDLSKFKYRRLPEIFKPQNTDFRQKLARQSIACQRIRAAGGRR